MPRRFEMGTLVTRCKQRADLENDDHIGTAEWKALISEQYGELWSLVSETGLRYFETSTTITADGSASYDEPDDHFSTLQIARVIDAGGREVLLRELMHQEESAVRGMTGDAFFWALADDQLFLYPKPSSGTYKWYYLQQPTDLSEYADDGVVDLVVPAGEAFLIWGVVVKAKAKSEADVTLAMAERERAALRVTEWAAQRSISEHRHRVTEDADDFRVTDPADWRWR
jgi:hypothetical protein